MSQEKPNLEEHLKELEVLIMFEDMLINLENPDKVAIFGTLKEEFESKQLLNTLQNDFR